LLRFELQKVLLAVVQHRDLGSVRGAEFVSERAAQLSSASPHKKRESRFEPNQRKKILNNLALSVMKSKVVDWTPGDFEKMFEGSDSEETQSYVVACVRAANLLADIATLLKRCKEHREKMEKEKVVLLPKRA
jgi:hypothetical protein